MEVSILGVVNGCEGGVEEDGNRDELLNHVES